MKRVITKFPNRGAWNEIGPRHSEWSRRRSGYGDNRQVGIGERDQGATHVPRVSNQICGSDVLVAKDVGAQFRILEGCGRFVFDPSRLEIEILGQSGRHEVSDWRSV